jgi:surface carbohydrate biosynthesis protein (TIGR04326 family)
MIAWQIHCQRRWLARTRPIVVAWPWENHSWERDFVRAARAAGVRTVGYQHSAIGRQMLNYAPRSNPDGPASLPDRVLCSGAGTRDQLARWGFPAERLGIGGALRFQRRAAPRHAKDAPVFVALPFDGATAAEMVEACRRDGRKFLIKDHPMTPFAFSGSNGIARTNAPLEAQKEVSAVLYAATTVGIESVLAGLPTLRFRPRGRIALDIAPPEVKVTPVDAESLGAALDAPPAPEPVDAARIFAPVDHATWREALA